MGGQSMFNNIQKKWIFVFIIGVVLFMSAVPYVNANWTFTADFEQGVEGTIAQGASGLTESFSKTLFSSENPHTGTKSARIEWVQGSVGWAEAGGSVIYHPVGPLSEGSEVWLRTYFYMKSPWDWTSDPASKLLRIHVEDVNNSNTGYHSLYIDPVGRLQLSNEPADEQTYSKDPQLQLSVDRWQSIEYYLKLSTTTPVFRIWKEGVMVMEDTTTPTLQKTTDSADFTYIRTYWNGGSPINQVEYMDDLVIFTKLPTETDRPANQDAAGNYMVGPTDWTTPSPAAPAAPKNLKVK
jgi:hypothetical protein